MPSPSTQQSYMSLKDGNVPQVDANGILANFIWSPKFVTKTAAYTVLAKETGTWFVTTGATAAVNFTLPKISDGPWVFFFISGADVNMTVTAETVDTMVTFNDLAADSVSYQTSSEIIGGFVIAACDGTSLFGLTPIISEAQTVTIATA